MIATNCCATRGVDALPIAAASSASSTEMAPPAALIACDDKTVSQFVRDSIIQKDIITRTSELERTIGWNTHLFHFFTQQSQLSLRQPWVHQAINSAGGDPLAVGLGGDTAAPPVDVEREPACMRE